MIPPNLERFTTTA